MNNLIWLGVGWYFCFYHQLELIRLRRRPLARLTLLSWRFERACARVRSWCGRIFVAHLRALLCAKRFEVWRTIVIASRKPDDTTKKTKWIQFQCNYCHYTQKNLITTQKMHQNLKKVIFQTFWVSCVVKQKIDGSFFHHTTQQKCFFQQQKKCFKW